MSLSEQLKILCVKLGISIYKLGRISGKSLQTFNPRIKLESISCPWCGAENDNDVTGSIITTHKLFTKGGASA